ncbi:MAG TPA: hypothetical protein VFB22_07985 [Candidatus Baltobacteraceae bacterium]|nr:hypothetical protein [Candidatus Baltobacteraceae bacterium]
MYFLFYLRMSRPNAPQRFSRRSRALTLIASIALIGSAILHYASSQIGVAVMLLLVIASVASTYADRRMPPRP